MANDGLERLAKKVVENLPQSSEQQVVIDPLTALAIVSLVVGVLRLLMETMNRYCPRDTDYKKVAVKPTLLQRFMLRRIIKRELHKDRNVHLSTNDLEQAILQTAKKASEAEWTIFLGSNS